MSASVLEIDDWQKFIDSNYHQLSRRIRVENLLTRLRSTSVISLEDQEMILGKYLTTFLKAGHLLDIVKTKGRAGFDHFMEAIEYEFPDVYKETTGRQPRPNPDKGLVDSKRRAAGASSILVLDKMGDLIHTFTEQLSRKHLELKQFEDLVHQLKAELMKQTEEQKSLDDQIRNLEDTVKELHDENKDLAESLTKERRIREEFEEKYDQLRSRNLFEMYKLTQQPLTKCVSLNPRPGASPMTSSSSSSPSSSLSPPTTSGGGSSNNNNLSSGGTVRRLKKAYEKGISTPCQPEAEAEAEVDKKTGSDVERSSDKVAELEENCCRLQESYDRLQCCIEEFRKDAEQCRAKQVEVESSSRETNAENEKLKTEMRKMEDQCKLMADMIRRLKDEIDARPEKPNKLKMPKIFPGSSSEEEPRTDSSSSASTLDRTTGRRTPVGTLPRPRPGDQNRAGVSESSPAANTLVHSSLGLLVNPWSSVDSN